MCIQGINSLITQPLKLSATLTNSFMLSWATVVVTWKNLIIFLDSYLTLSWPEISVGIIEVFCFHESLEPETNFERWSPYCFESIIDLLADQAFDDLISLESYRVTVAYNTSVYSKLQAFTGSLFLKWSKVRVCRLYLNWLSKRLAQSGCCHNNI